MKNNRLVGIIWTALFALGMTLQSGCALLSESTDSAGCVLTSHKLAATAGKEVGIGLDTLGGQAAAQPFILTADGTALSIKAQLSKVGSFTAAEHLLTASIESDNGANPSGPSGTALATGTLDPASISTTATYYKFSLSNAVDLTAETLYWLKIRGSFATNENNYILWSGVDGAAKAYTVNGTTLNAKYDDGFGLFSTTLIGDLRFLNFSVDCD